MRARLFSLLPMWLVFLLAAGTLAIAGKMVHSAFSDPETPSDASDFFSGAGVGYSALSFFALSFGAVLWRWLSAGVRRDNRRYESIVNRIPVPVFVMDADRRWNYVNPAAIALLGKKREELIGQPTTTIPVLAGLRPDAEEAQTVVIHDQEWDVHFGVLRDAGNALLGC